MELVRGKQLFAFSSKTFLLKQKNSFGRARLFDTLEVTCSGIRIFLLLSCRAVKKMISFLNASFLNFSLANLTCFVNGPNPASFPLFIFVLFSTQSPMKVQNLTTNGRRVDGVLGIRTHDYRMVGSDESTELWRPPLLIVCGKRPKT